MKRLVVFSRFGAGSKVPLGARKVHQPNRRIDIDGKADGVKELDEVDDPEELEELEKLAKLVEMDRQSGGLSHMPLVPTMSTREALGQGIYRVYREAEVLGGILDERLALFDTIDMERLYRLSNEQFWDEVEERVKTG